MIYLDYTAHMPASQAALQALCQAETACIGNANAHHIAGSIASEAVQKAVTDIASCLGLDGQEIILTSGASESNNTAIQGFTYASRHFGRHIITSPLEHPSVSGCLTALQDHGYEIDVLPLNQDGIIDLAALQQTIRPDTVLMTLCTVDSELGTLQPVHEVAEIVRQYPNCHFHMDATQAIGKIPVDCSIADTVSFSAHKFGGLTGSGALIKRKETEMEPLIYGGVSTSLYRSGTPAVGLASSTAAALTEATHDLNQNLETVTALNVFLREELSRRHLRIHSPKDAIPHILNVGIDGMKGSAVRDALSAKGVCISVKSACSVENTPSRAVYAMTQNRRQALESWRISLSHLTTKDELLEFLTVLDTILEAKGT